MLVRRLIHFVATSFAWVSIAQAQSPTDADPTIIPYVAPSVVAQVAPGRNINLVCMGRGSPTVIFTAGLGNWSEIWRQVQPSVAKKTQTRQL